MNRNLIDFQMEQNDKKNRIGNKDIEIKNIKNTPSGLLFNIKIYEEEIKDLLIPIKYYSEQRNNYTNYDSKKNIKKNTFGTIFVSYFILLPLTILSVSLIFATIFKYLPTLQNILNFNFIY